MYLTLIGPYKMAKRYVYLPSHNSNELVEKIEIEFEWFPGFSASQKQKSLAALHNVFSQSYTNKVLEVSSKSTETLGIELSAFNLTTLINEKVTSVESLFQGSKVFENGTNYSDLYLVSSLDAKRDPRIKTSGNVIAFDFFGRRFPTNPPTFFYDWLYINTLLKNPQYHAAVLEYGAFTDIEFNPKKQINCQAYSLALFVSLHRRGLIEGDVGITKEKFMELVKVDDGSLDLLSGLG